MTTKPAIGDRVLVRQMRNVRQGQNIENPHDAVESGDYWIEAGATVVSHQKQPGIGLNLVLDDGTKMFGIGESFAEGAPGWFAR